LLPNNTFKIGSIPSAQWGNGKDVFIAVHGNMASKTDPTIEIFAEVAAAKGYSVISFDLPEHGERKTENRLCNPQNCVNDLLQVYEYAKTEFETASFFGCSIGAYFAMLAFEKLPIKQAVFLSPVVDMTRIIKNIMAVFNITPEDLKQNGIIETPIKKLYFDYYDYVKNTPVKWGVPTEILYGENDDICEQNIVRSFAENSGAKLTVAKNCEHWFHTNYQLDVLRKWLIETVG
jgi:pimeloyl-ACP methyl ester carboxylesterase